MRHGWWLGAVFFLWPGLGRPLAPDPATPTAETFSADVKPSSPPIGVPDAEALEKSLRDRPLAYLAESIQKYDKDVRGYSLTFYKRERLGGTLQPHEKVEVHFRESPFSVQMRWIEGAKLANKVLYVEGENEGKMLAKPRGLLAIAGIVTRDVDGADAKSSGRYTIAQFGFKRSTQRSLASMTKAQERGALHLKYAGVVAVPQLGGQKCRTFVRSPYDPPEEDGLNELTLYFDDRGLQVGSILRDTKGELLGEYFFYDLKLNPEWPANQFRREGL